MEGNGDGTKWEWNEIGMAWNRQERRDHRALHIEKHTLVSETYIFIVCAHVYTRWYTRW